MTIGTAVGRELAINELDVISAGGDDGFSNQDKMGNFQIQMAMGDNSVPQNTPSSVLKWLHGAGSVSVVFTPRL